MTADEYWNADPLLVIGYRKASEIRKANDNYMAWLNGLYTYKAAQSVMHQLIYSLNGAKGETPEEYIDYPIPITKIEVEQEKQRNIEKTLRFIEEGQR